MLASHGLSPRSRVEDGQRGIRLRFSTKTVELLGPSIEPFQTLRQQLEPATASAHLESTVDLVRQDINAGNIVVTLSWELRHLLAVA